MRTCFGQNLIPKSGCLGWSVPPSVFAEEFPKRLREAKVWTNWTNCTKTHAPVSSRKTGGVVVVVLGVFAVVFGQIPQGRRAEIASMAVRIA